MKRFYQLYLKRKKVYTSSPFSLSNVPLISSYSYDTGFLHKSPPLSRCSSSSSSSSPSPSPLFPTLSSKTPTSSPVFPALLKKSHSELSMREHYELYLRKNQFQSDFQQVYALSYFEELRKQLIERNSEAVVHKDKDDENKMHCSFLSRWFSASLKNGTKRKPIKGIYLYGSVGSGKTMLMDLFHNVLPGHIQRKRTHFHSFMLDVHKKSHELQSKQPSAKHDLDPYSLYIEHTAKNLELVCLDEFQVVHITDAMILRKLLTSFMDLGVTFVFTSNRHPSELYLNGLQRPSFLPCIDFILQNTHVINLSSNKDYRYSESSRYRVFLYPDAYAHSKLNQVTTALGTFAPFQLTHTYHKLPISHVLNRAARVSFHELCETPVSTLLYHRLVESYPILIIDAIPWFHLHQDRNSLRRWITFIDIAYEAKTQCIFHTPGPLHQLLTSEPSDVNASDEEHFAWNRMLSRLNQMQMENWVTDPDLKRVLDLVN